MLFYAYLQSCCAAFFSCQSPMPLVPNLRRVGVAIWLCLTAPSCHQTYRQKKRGVGLVPDFTGRFRLAPSVCLKCLTPGLCSNHPWGSYVLFARAALMLSMRLSMDVQPLLRTTLCQTQTLLRWGQSPLMSLPNPLGLLPDE